MDRSRKSREKKQSEERDIELSQEQQTLADLFSNGSYDESDDDLSEFQGLFKETTDNDVGYPILPKKLFESDDTIVKSESGTIEIFSEESELSDESALEKVEQQILPEETSITEETLEASMELLLPPKVEVEEVAIEQISAELEEEEEEEGEVEEELWEPGMYEEWEKERRILQFHKDLEEVLNYEFPETLNEEEDIKLLVYESMLKELEKEDREIDIMLRDLDKNENIIFTIEKTVGPLIAHYEKEVCAFRKVGDEGFTDVEGEEEEDVEDEYRNRAAEMAKEILEAEDIESVGSLGKESSGDDLSNMLSQMAADLKESEHEIEKEEVVVKKAPVKQKKKLQSRRMSKTKLEPKKRKK